jgi:hypothetical protein
MTTIVAEFRPADLESPDIADAEAAAAAFLATGSVIVTEALRGLLADDERHRADWPCSIACEPA